MLLLTFVLQYIASEDIFASSIEILDNVWIWISKKKTIKASIFQWLLSPQNLIRICNLWVLAS